MDNYHQLYKRIIVIVPTVLLTLIWTGCGTDQKADDWILSQQFSNIVEPTLLISTDGIEYGGSISARYNEIYHVINDSAWTGSYGVVRTYENGSFGKEDTLKFGGETMQGGDIHLSYEGEQLFFTSRFNTDTTQSDGNIWSTSRTPNGWSDAKLLPNAVNSELGEYSPSLSKSGNLYFTRFSEETSGDIFMSEYSNGHYEEAVSLAGQLNSDSMEADAWVSPSEDFILFVRRSGVDGYGVTDISISFNEAGIWTAAQVLDEPYNSRGVDGSPILTPDGKYIIFTSNRAAEDCTVFDGNLDIYACPIDIESIKKLHLIN